MLVLPLLLVLLGWVGGYVGDHWFREYDGHWDGVSSRRPSMGFNTFVMVRQKRSSRLRDEVSSMIISFEDNNGLVS